MTHRDEAIYARADAHAITLTADEAAFIAVALRREAAVLEHDPYFRASEHSQDNAKRMRSLIARLEAASTTPPS